MDWQSMIAIGVAVLSGLWILSRFAQPFLAERAACSACAACNREAPTYMHIEMAESGKRP